VANEIIGIEAVFDSGNFDKGAKSVLEGINRIINQLTVLNAMTFATGKNVGAMTQNMQDNAKKIVDAAEKIRQGIGSAGSGGMGGGGAGGGTFGEAGENAGNDFMRGFANINWSRVIRDFQGFGSVLGGALGGPLGMAIGSTLGKVFDDAGRMIKDFINGVVSMVGQTIEGLFIVLSSKAVYFQDQMIYLDTLLARIGVEQGGFASVGEALDSIGDSADALLARIQELALETPYAIDEVLNMFRSLTGRGVNIDLALDTIKSLSDAGAGLALPNYELTRLTQNLVQVATTGKLYERDIYEFGRAGIDVAQMLRQYLNMSVEEAKVALREGAVSAEEFLKIFNQFTADKFEGAAERLTRTVSGMYQKFEDIRNFLGKDIFGPVFDDLAEPLTKILDALIAISTSPIPRMFGDTFAQMFRDIGFLTRYSIEDIQKEILEFVLWFLRLANRFAPYGYEMMLNWGIGLVKGAIKAITAVVRLISGMFKWFLAPGSPPRAVPDIYKWGVDTLTEYMKGMLNADFDILENIQDPLEKVLSQLEFSPNQITSMLQEFTVGFTKALQKFKLTGIIDKAFLDQVRSMGFEYGNALAKLTKLQFKLSGAQDAVNIAEKLLELEEERLEKAKEYYDVSDANVRKLVQEYNTLLRAGASKDILAVKKEEINAQIDNREEAAKNIELSEKAVDKAEEQLDVSRKQLELIEERVEKQEKLLNQLLRLTQYELDAVDAAGKLEDALSDIDDLGIGIEPPDFSEFDTVLNAELEQLEKDINAELVNLRSDWAIFLFKLRQEWRKTDWASETQPLIDAFTNLNSSAEDLLALLSGKGGLQEALKNFWRYVAFPLPEGWWESYDEYLETPKNEGYTRMMDREPQEGMRFDPFTWGSNMGLKAREAFISSFNDQSQRRGMFDGLTSEELKTRWNTFWQNLGLGAGYILSNIDTSGYERQFSNLTSEERRTIWQTFWINLKQNVNDSLSNIDDSGYNRMFDGLTSEEKQNRWSTLWKTFRSKVTMTLLDIETDVTTTFNLIGAKIDTFVVLKKIQWDQFWDDIYTKLKTVVDDMKRKVTEKFDDIGLEFETLQTFVDDLRSAFQTLHTWMSNVVTKLGELWTALLQGTLPDWLLSMFPGSPPPFAIGMKLNTAELEKFSGAVSDMKVGIRSSDYLKSGRVTPSTVSNVNTSNIYNFGGNNINNGMDIAMFDVMMQRALARSIT